MAVQRISAVKACDGDDKCGIIYPEIITQPSHLHSCKDIVFYYNLIRWLLLTAGNISSSLVDTHTSRAIEADIGVMERS